jgi:ankyrin repeat protein
VVCSRDNDGYTPLMLATKAKNVEVVRMLVETMANPLLTNDVGHTARDIAEALGLSECAAALREYE